MLSPEGKIVRTFCAITLAAQVGCATKDIPTFEELSSTQQFRCVEDVLSYSILTLGNAGTDRNVCSDQPAQSQQGDKNNK
jgi:hypothetical protein